MPSKRRFYRTVIQVEVLSEEPFGFKDLADVHGAITDGDCSGRVTVPNRNEKVNGKRMATLLLAQGSDPSFFRLSEDGEADDDEAN